MLGEQAKRWAEPGVLPLGHSRKPCLCKPGQSWGGGSYPPSCSLLLPVHSASASCDLDSLPTCAMLQATLPTCLPLSLQISAPGLLPPAQTASSLFSRNLKEILRSLCRLLPIWIGLSSSHHTTSQARQGHGHRMEQ